MLIAEGEAVAVDREMLRETNSRIAHTFVRLDAPSEQFARNLRSNHIHAVYGSVSQVLEEACRVLEIDPIAL